MSVVGLPATIPLGGVGGAFALFSSGLIVASKKLDSKIKKHQKILTLAIAKRDTVDRLLSKTLADNQITDSEFQLIMTEFSQYNVLKEAVRAKLTRKPSRPNVDKIRKDVRSEVEEEFRKKINALGAFSNSLRTQTVSRLLFHSAGKNRRESDFRDVSSYEPITVHLAYLKR